MTVGNVTVDTSANAQDGYWTTDTSGTLTVCQSTDSWNVHYDVSTNTLTLNGAKITGGNNIFRAGIYAATFQDQLVSLTIVLEGTNTVSGSMGIYVLEEWSTTNGGASLTITGGGSLTASGRSGIMVQGNHGNSTLTIQNANVTAQGNAYGNGVTVRSGGTNSGTHTITLSVEGGSLTARGRNGIGFDSASSVTISAVNLTVGGNAIVRGQRRDQFHLHR